MALAGDRTITAIQTTELARNTALVIICVVLFLPYIVPGVSVLVHMHRNAGSRVHILAGALRAEVRFNTTAAAMLEDFDILLEQATANSQHASREVGAL